MMKTNVNTGLTTTKFNSLLNGNKDSTTATNSTD